MPSHLIHISDIHYREGWEESHEVVFRAFFDDLEKQIKKVGQKKTFLFISGDIVKRGEDYSSYENFIRQFDRNLSILGITKYFRVCTPGNHDLSQDVVKNRRIDHEGVISSGLPETAFNDYFDNPAGVFTDKFFNYKNFEERFSAHPSLQKSIGGCGSHISDTIGVYRLNSALFSSGGLKDTNGNKINDKKRLAVVTREIHSWADNSSAPFKILIMHHHRNWMSKWAEDELSTIIRKYFSLCLTGHDHEQSDLHSIHGDRSVVELSAPPLFTDKSQDLGYSIIRVDSAGRIESIQYRQWARKHHSFVSGSSFSNTDDGVICIAHAYPRQDHAQQSHIQGPDAVEIHLSTKLNDALASFSTQPRIWVERILSKNGESSSSRKPADALEVSSIIQSPRSAFIKAPPQFGLTCLAHHLALNAWRMNQSHFWLHIDANKINPSKKAIENHVDNELKQLNLTIEDLKCILLDSWSASAKNAVKLLSCLSGVYPSVHLIVLQTIETAQILNSFDEELIGRSFDDLYLLSLPREQVRQVVTNYNDVKHIGDEDSITSKVVADLEVLNIHRTPLNCLTILKASEVDFDESPVNRTEMLSRVLFLLFNVDGLPTYKLRPDLKDCEFVIGYFCETMIRDDQYTFTREQFIVCVQELCTERVMDLDVSVVFDVLYTNNIIIGFGDTFRFRFLYWLYYFAALRMHHSIEFANFIYSDMRYNRFPEIIEFYTGIDRRREDALIVLLKDLEECRNNVKYKCGLPDGMNPYQYVRVKQTPEMLAQLEKEVKDGVTASNFPAVVKDRYADATYDHSRPYHQEVTSIMKEYSLVHLMRSTTAASRALRNSDYASPDIKRKLLKEILLSWQELTKVIVVLIPPLADSGHAVFDGAGFYLVSGFSDDKEERFMQILTELPTNVVSWYRDDIFSQKMGPLLIQHLKHEDDHIRRHQLVLLLIFQRPRGWKGEVQRYITENGKNSFYLNDVQRRLRLQYMYSYASKNELKDIAYLIKMASLKQLRGAKNPSATSVNRVSNEVLPNREVD